MKDKDVFHPKAYGLSSKQREHIASMAISGRYYEAYIASCFNKPITQIRDICLKLEGYVCKKLERVDDELIHHDGFYIDSKANQ